MTKYPESEKLSKLKEDYQELGEFLSWLKSKYVMAEWVDTSTMEYEDVQLSPLFRNNETILSEYFGIDREKLEEERRQILEDLKNG